MGPTGPAARGWKSRWRGWEMADRAVAERAVAPCHCCRPLGGLAAAVPCRLIGAGLLAIGLLAPDGPLGLGTVRTPSPGVTIGPAARTSGGGRTWTASIAMRVPPEPGAVSAPAAEFRPREVARGRPRRAWGRRAAGAPGDSERVGSDVAVDKPRRATSSGNGSRPTGWSAAEPFVAGPSEPGRRYPLGRPAPVPTRRREPKDTPTSLAKRLVVAETRPIPDRRKRCRVCGKVNRVTTPAESEVGG
jgi:hypothetical protein